MYRSVELSNANFVIASQFANYSALRAAFGGCALYRPAGLVAWQSASPARQRLACAKGTQTTRRVMSLYERQRERIATPVCALVRDDMIIDSLLQLISGVKIDTFWTADGHPYELHSPFSWKIAEKTAQKPGHIPSNTCINSEIGGVIL